MPRSTYYYWINKLNNNDKYKEIKEEILSIYHENKGRYGYRRITLELKNRGFLINHKTVWIVNTFLDNFYKDTFLY